MHFDSTWLGLFALAMLFMTLLAVHEAMRSYLLTSRFARSATLLGGLVITMWLLTLGGMVVGGGMWMAILGLFLSLLWGAATLRAARVMCEPLCGRFDDRARDDSRNQVHAILHALREATTHDVLAELNVTEGRLREVYQQLRNRGLDAGAARTVLSDAKMLRHLFSGRLPRSTSEAAAAGAAGTGDRLAL